MADEYRKNSVKLGVCLNSLKKMLPDLPQEVVDEFPNAIESSADTMISRSDFDLIFKEQSTNTNQGSAKK